MASHIKATLTFRGDDGETVNLKPRNSVQRHEAV